MQLSGWKETNKAYAGDVLVWTEKDYDGEKHKHIGFCIGKNKAISINDKKGVPVIHDWNYNGKRKIEKILTKFLEKK